MPPLDPNIALGIQMPQFQSPMQTMGDILQMRGMQEQQRARQQEEQTRQLQQQEANLQIQKATRDQNDEQSYRDLVMQSTPPGGEPDYQQIERTLLAQGNIPGAKMAGAEHDSKIQKQIQQYTATVNLHDKQFSAVRPLFNDAEEAFASPDPEEQAKAPALYKRAVETVQKTWGIKTGVPMPPESGIPDFASEMDPNKPDAALAKVGADYLLKGQELIDRERAVAEKVNTAYRLKKEGKDATKAEQDAYIAGYGSTQNQQGVDLLRKKAVQLGYSQATIDLMPPQWDPNMVSQANAMTMTPEQRAQEADRARGQALAARAANRADMDASAKLANDAGSLDKWYTEELAKIDDRARGNADSPRATPDGGSSVKAPVTGGGVLDLNIGGSRPPLSSDDATRERSELKRAYQLAQKRLTDAVTPSGSVPAGGNKGQSQVQAQAKAAIAAQRQRVGQMAPVTDADVTAFLKKNPTFGQ